MSKIKKIVEPKKFLKNQNIKIENKGEYPYCYCPDCRCEECNN